MERAKNATELFSLISKGVLKIEINQRYKLKDINQAHIELAGRLTRGSSIIIPD